MDDGSPASVENPHAGTGSVLLDVGGDVGALVVNMPAHTVGDEVEIHPEGTDLAALRVHDAEHAAGHGHGHGHHHDHVAVVVRPTPGGPRPSLVYPELTQGRYLLCPVGADTAVLTAEISGGTVTEVDWPGLRTPE
ncbi:hypothetical protein [Nocardioides sp. CFH 31398]|uniref:hypothetical protein n=1 Tax=Nocardioides sp. CFH 31398 TaxID=2919579 RepID=UPI001F055526|nr:hypothetical protein [Nocardioides sp. CFH 31398]MCH1867709.1 hypothetical protein [Nocardioides sp. CFH 31398]